jgi:hypothetical protein
MTKNERQWTILGLDMILRPIKKLSLLFPEAHMITVRVYLIAIADCLCLGLNEVAMDLSIRCGKFIKKF